MEETQVHDISMSPLQASKPCLFSSLTAATDDFVRASSIIDSDRNCTALYTLDDTEYERTKVYDVMLHPADEKTRTNLADVHYTIILEDDDGATLQLITFS